MSKKKRLVVHQEIGETSGHRGEGSPYWDHLERFGKRTKEGTIAENKFANPDVLAHDSTNTIWGTGTKPELAELFIERFADDNGNFPILSKMENKVLNNMLRYGGSVAYTRKALKLSRSSCNTYLARIRRKFKRLLPLLDF